MNKQEAKFIPKLTPDNEVDNASLSNKEFFSNLTLPINSTDSEETTKAKKSINGYLGTLMLTGEYPGFVPLLTGIFTLVYIDDPDEKFRKEIWRLSSPIISLILNRFVK